MTISRWQPFREMMTLRDAMDRLFDDTLFRESGTAMGTLGALPLDLIERDDELVVRASVPGFDPEQIDISLQGDVLTLRGSTEQKQEDERDRYHLREHRVQSFQRAIRLPVDVDGDKVTAQCENGVLTIHMPKAPESGARRITVGSGRQLGDRKADYETQSREQRGDSEGEQQGGNGQG